jgi:hypothetical protein
MKLRIKALLANSGKYAAIKVLWLGSHLSQHTAISEYGNSIPIIPERKAKYTAVRQP